MGIADYGSVASLLGNMEAVKKRLEGGLTQNNPNAFGVAAPPPGPPADAPVAPPPSLMASAPPTSAFPVANPAEDVHNHQQGKRGWLLHLLGADRTSPEITSLVGTERAKQIQPGVTNSLWNLIAYGKSPQTTIQERAKNIVSLQDTAKSRAETARAESVKQRLRVRYGPMLAEAKTPQERNNVLANYWSELAINNVTDAMAPMNNAVSQLVDIPTPTKTPEPSWQIKNGKIGGKPITYKVDANSVNATPAYLDGRSIPPEVLAQIQPYEPPVQQSFVAFPAQTDNGTVPVLNSKTGAITDSGFQVREGAGVGSAINQAAKARLSAAISEMNNAHSGMADFERGLQDGTVKISASSQLLQRLANSFTHDDPISQATQSAGLALLNRTDPALARYIRRGMSFAEGESMISQRPSDFRTKMAAFLSTAASGASPEMVHDIESRRASILNPLNEMQAQEKSRRAPRQATGSTKPSLDERIAELKAEGKNKEEARAILKAEGYIK